MALVRKVKPDAGNMPPTPGKRTAWVQAHPLLWEYLTSAVYADGSQRQTSTLSVMCGDATGVKVVLNDREEGMSLWATGEDVPDCLDVLELLLADDEAPWKRDKRHYLKPAPRKPGVAKP